MNLNNEIMTNVKKKKRHQVKSRWYYIFWGAATVSVFAGQMYVGSGYRRMAKSFDRLVDVIVVDMERDYFTGKPKFLLR